VQQVEFLSHPDAALADTPALRRDLVALIRRTRPELVLSLDPTTWFLQGRVNHPDHRALGSAVIAACWPTAGNPLAFPELLEQGLAPWHPQALWLSATHEPDHFVDITRYFEQKVDALACNASQLEPDARTRRAGAHASLHEAFGHTDERGATSYIEGFRVLAL
jgi:LmbE family N-acetylglucosaminyl deacetylase